MLSLGYIMMDLRVLVPSKMTCTLICSKILLEFFHEARNMWNRNEDFYCLLNQYQDLP